jgi:predicted aspartyl protease
MGLRCCSSFAALLLLFPAAGMVSSPARGQEIPLERCDSLPVLEVIVGGQPMRFLVDTAATSFLNLKSFSEGKARDVRVTSWSGTLATSAREVTLEEVEVGSTKFVGLKLPAVDLSAVGSACGKKIDGILGVDLLAKLGATIDLKKQTVRVTTVNDERGAQLAAEMHREMHHCLEAFNNSDEKSFGDCLDPKIVLFSLDTELYGREQVIGYFRDRYFHQKPAARLEIRESAFHPIGEAVWYEYEFTIESARGLLRGRGMAMCRRSEGFWRMVSMHHSVMEMEPLPAAK